MARRRVRAGAKWVWWLPAVVACAITLAAGPPVVWTSCVRGLQAGDGPVHAMVYASYRNGLSARPTRIHVSLAASSDRTTYIAVRPTDLECFEWLVWDSPPEGAPLGTLSPDFLAARIPGDRAKELAPRLDQFIRHASVAGAEALSDPFPSYPPEPADTAVADPGTWYALDEGPGTRLGIQLARPGLIWLGIYAPLRVAAVLWRRRVSLASCAKCAAPPQP